MKTRVSKALTFMSLLFLFASCQEEEFYEKDYIDTVKDQYERSQIPDEEAEQGWEDPAYNPPGDGGSGDDGSGDDGSGDDGSGDDDSCTPGTNCDGGSGDGDSGDDDSCTPGTNCDGGSGDGDSGDDDSCGPASCDGGSGEGDNPSYNDMVESFVQEQNGAKVDILWVIDNSGSMKDEQEALGANFDAFIADFIHKDIDFQMAVTTTDTRQNNAGREYKDSMSVLKKEKLDANQNKFMEDFAEMVRVGTNGSGREKGIKASEVFTNRHKDWLRADAYYAIVYMSDEEDQSEKTVARHLAQISKWKDNPGKVKAYSIVDMVPFDDRGAIVRGYDRYNKMSTLTNGSVASIKSDFHQTLLSIGEEISQLTELFPLSNSPIDSDQIEVFVDGTQVINFSYRSDVNAIKFDTPPAAGSEITVEYQY